MDLLGFRSLLTPLGREALAAAANLSPRELDFLQHFTSLSRRYPPELARSALEIAILRLEAVSRFPNASAMFFTRPALEQASNPEISGYRMQRFAAFTRVFDLGCSIGADTLALSRFTATLGIDLDPLGLAMASANLHAIMPAADVHFIQSDLTSPLPFEIAAADAIFFDPARRHNGRRVHSVHHYHPPLEVIRNWLPKNPAIGIKISPGVKSTELSAYNAEIEFISHAGELKEAVLWFGPLHTASRRATLLPGPHTLSAPPVHGLLSDPLADTAPPPPLSEPLAYLFEPDPAVLRAGLIRTLAGQMDAAQLDPDIAYLTTDHLLSTPFARIYPVETWLPFSVKRLKIALRQRGIESIVVKKRGSPIPPETLIRQLGMKPGSGSLPGERIVFLTHLRGSPIAVVCHPPL